MINAQVGEWVWVWWVKGLKENLFTIKTKRKST